MDDIRYLQVVEGTPTKLESIDYTHTLPVTFFDLLMGQFIVEGMQYEPVLNAKISPVFICWN